MNHPPIPPDCDLFVKHSQRDLWLFKIPDNDADGGFHLLALSDDGFEQQVTDDIERTIIASVARCAWLDEAERWRKQRNIHNENKEQTEIYHSTREAMIYNAELWRKWNEMPALNGTGLNSETSGTRTAAQAEK